MQELLRKLPNCLLDCRFYEQWLSTADKTPDDAAPAMKRLQLITSCVVTILFLLTLFICYRHCQL